MSGNRINNRKKRYYARCDGGSWEKVDHCQRGGDGEGSAEQSCYDWRASDDEERREKTSDEGE